MSFKPVPMVDLHAQYLSIKTEIDEAIASVIAESAFIRGKYVDNFESAFAQLLGVNHCVSCANGTDALYIAMKSLGVKPGDEVITTAHSWISTSETITQAGGKVVFCDTDSSTFTIDPSQITDKITARTVGIIPVHLYGQPADMDYIMNIAQKYGLWVIEDCAQSHLARYKGQLVGTIGQFGTFSFYPGKNLGAMGDAGCLVTQDAKLADWCSLYARHGGKGNHQMEGVNSRMDGLQAAILLAKLPHLPNWTEKRQRVAELYNRKFNNFPFVMTPFVAPGRDHVYHLYVICVSNRDRVREYLSMQGILTGINYPKLLPFYPAYGYLNHQPSDFPHAVSNQERILSLPMYPEMTENQVEYVVSSIQKFFFQ
ncbi:erythromycin biosynthesis sensory transduction protein eryC1 [Cylindrospermopsis raciborskii CENA303]|uniref:Erythromycin biosynthesis sensory transduction protein eryC1 n=1 Tax=Cylindrospermopsis raciborskii CENA303 TaxID=1170769 RepID=A0A1X4GJ31_9CYAN|nr:DegT/DnrJ/EryC1/StrS family aminotransferase [Cylindrospermopsis raciborskii]OSO97113.1 erythromycin biosynthesis sensory transduction protein eryC1 [Cylindrospermopsis raciborskii CENA303]